VGAINRPHPLLYLVGQSSKPRNTPRSKSWAPQLSLKPPIRILCIWERIWALPWVSRSIQVRALYHLHRRPLLHSLFFGTCSPRRLGVTRELPRLWLSHGKFVLSSSSCRFLVENQVELGGDLGGLGLKETRSFVDFLMETWTSLWCWTSRINLVSLMLFVTYFLLHIFVYRFLKFLT
jgi:hypothetical protein